MQLSPLKDFGKALLQTKSSPIFFSYKLSERKPLFEIAQCHGSFRHVARPIPAFDNIQTLLSPIIFFTSMCFESKTRVSALVPCVLELHLELRRFISMGKCWNTKYRGISVVIVPYIRDNSVCTG